MACPPLAELRLAAHKLLIHSLSLCQKQKLNTHTSGELETQLQKLCADLNWIAIRERQGLISKKEAEKLTAETKAKITPLQEQQIQLHWGGDRQAALKWLILISMPLRKYGLQ